MHPCFLKERYTVIRDRFSTDFPKCCLNYKQIQYLMFMFWVFGIFLVSNIKYEYGQILNEWGALFCNFLQLPPPVRLESMSQYMISFFTLTASLWDSLWNETHYYKTHGMGVFCWSDFPETFQHPVSFGLYCTINLVRKKVCPAPVFLPVSL